MEIKEKDIAFGRIKPYLDNTVIEVEKVDKKIDWFLTKIKELEKEKQNKLNAVNDLFEDTLTSKHVLDNGYTVKIDDKYKIEIESIPDFLKWLKLNCEPHEVLGFFDSAIKLTKLKSFCEKKINEMKINGELNINIDGIKIYDATFRRLTTERKRGKK